MPITPDQPLTRAQEVQRLLKLYGPDDPRGAMDLLDRQFAALTSRAQMLLGLCGIVVTTTGFSGRIIAGTSRLAQLAIITGISFTLLAAAVVVWGVLHLRWITQQPGQLLEPWLDQCLAYRDRKLQCYRVGIVLLMLGLTAYVISIALMLWAPTAHAVTLTR